MSLRLVVLGCVAQPIRSVANARDGCNIDTNYWSTCVAEVRLLLDCVLRP
jgi:hypothetical protein